MSKICYNFIYVTLSLQGMEGLIRISSQTELLTEFLFINFTKMKEFHKSE